MMRLATLTSALLLAFAAVAQAQTIDLTRYMDCSPYSGGTRTISFSVPLPEKDIPNLLDPPATQRVLQGAANLVVGHCRQFLAARQIPPQSITGVYVNINSESNVRLVTSFFDINAGTWQIENIVIDSAARKSRQQQQAQAEAAAKLKTENNSATALNDFVKQNGVTAFVAVTNLATNPYPYVGKVVGIRTSFGQMMSSNEARFNDLFVSGVSPTQFTTPNMLVVLAVKISGLKPVAIPGGGQMNFPYGTLVAAHVCRQSNCAEFFNNQ